MQSELQTQKSKSRQPSLFKQELAQQDLQLQASLTKQKQKELSITTTIQIEESKLGSALVEIQRERQRTKIPTITELIGITDIPSKKKKPPIFPSKRKSISRRKRKANSYNVFVIPTKQRKFKQIQTRVTKQQAQDTRDFFIDQTLSRTGKIVPSQASPKKSQLNIPKGYSIKIKNKLRNFRIKRGNKIRVNPDRKIEKRGFLLDTKNEIRQITTARLLKKRKKKKGGKK